MRTIALVLAVVAGLAASGAGAAGEPAPVGAPAGASDSLAGLPKEVVRAVRELEAACAAEGGAARWNAKGLIEEVSFSADGRPDYLIDTHAMECSASFTPWIGSDGFRHIIIVSTGAGRWVRAFDRSARGLEIVAAGGETRLVLFSHSGDCTRPNPKRYQRCTQEYSWRHGKLKLISEEWFTD